MNLSNFIKCLVAGSILVSATACTKNAVTGERELSLLVGEKEEREIGRRAYAPTLQSQGGEHAVDPELTAYVQRVGQRLAAVSDRRLPYEFKVLNNSTPNAWALPDGKIAINRGLLLELQSEAELAAVLGHEVVHSAAGHTRQRLEKSKWAQIGMTAAAIGMQSQGYRYTNEVMQGAQLGIGAAFSKNGRDHERESDKYGMKYMAKAGYHPQAAVELQKTFVRLSKGRNSSFIEGLFASHPPSAERVKNNEKAVGKLLKKYPNARDWGRERYQRATRRLRENKAAYDAHDKGRAALKQGKLDLAANYAQKALRLNPRESHFHQLRGEIRLAQKRYGDALVNYNRAVENNSRFFANYLGRGVTKQKMGDENGARQDFEKSIKLYPSSTALKALGKSYAASGQVERAKALWAAGNQQRGFMQQLTRGSRAFKDPEIQYSIVSKIVVGQ